MSRVYLSVDFSEKEEVKAKGGFWDNERKMWYCFESNKDSFSKWNVPMIPINVPYSDKDEVRKMGARWDSSLMKWTIRQDKTTLFARWL
jgi:hypothetical protein